MKSALSEAPEGKGPEKGIFSVTDLVRDPILNPPHPDAHKWLPAKSGNRYPSEDEPLPTANWYFGINSIFNTPKEKIYE